MIPTVPQSFTNSGVVMTDTGLQLAEARFNTIVEEYSKLLRSAIVQACPRDLGIQTGDIEQEARLRIWQALLREREIENLASYLYRIAVTTTIDAIRRMKARREEQLVLEEEAEDEASSGLSLPAHPDGSPERVAQREQIATKIRLALTRLQASRRRAVEFHLEGFTNLEITELLGWSEPKVRNLIHRGLKDLRSQLQTEGISLETID